jgi:hypothetical protein
VALLPCGPSQPSDSNHFDDTIAFVNGEVMLQGAQAIENLLGRIAGLSRYQSLFGYGNVLVGEPVCYVPKVPASGVADLDIFGCFGNELGLLVIDNNVLHGMVS